ncbi:IST1 homolog [Portunus trituberculatus]|nr:IST1 homolog [Portunus trituberculatus]XP_045123621.1 IST1 homolog [Portunus trituberculatus]
MFSSGPNYTKLKTNLRLSINRLKLLEKKKTELAQKARKEIADYLSTGKTERAKIRVEHIIREDYLVEAMEVTEMYCDLLLARYGLIQQMKDLDEGLAEAVSSLIWAAPRLQTDVAELKVIADQLTLKFGKPYGQACREQQVTTISERLIHKLNVQAPPKVLVEKYLIEIAKNYNVEYEPDPQVMREEEWGKEPLISLDEKNNFDNDGAGAGGGGSGVNIAPAAGFIGYPPQPMPQQPFVYPTPVLFPSQMPHEAPALPAKLPPPEPQSSWVSSLSPASPLQPSCEDSRILVGGKMQVPSLLLTNPQSLTNCFEEFKEVVTCHNPDIVVVSETWFSETRPAAQHNLAGYKLFHDDREGRGGGVAVYARQSLNPREVQLKAPPELECVWVAVDGGMMVCGLYHAPRAPTGPALMDQIVNCVVDIRSHNPSMVFAVAGDFNNLPHNRLCACLNLTNLVQEPTHLNSTIDLVLTDAAGAFERPRLLPPIGRSHHSCVLVTPKTYQGAGVLDLNLPNVPGQPVHPQPGMPAGSFNIPPCGPPPADSSADALPEKITNNMQDFSGSGQWNDPMGMKNSPPPYSSIPPMGHTSNTTPAPNAPYPSMPYAGLQGPRPQFPPDVATGGENLKDGEQPKPAPRSKFGEGGSDFTMPDLPSVPDLPGTGTLPEPQDNKDDIDFDDLTKRFEDLKKKK